MNVSDLRFAQLPEDLQDVEFALARAYV